MATRTVNVSITLPKPMLAEVDRACEAEHRTRSEFFREAARHYIYRGGLPSARPARGEAAALAAGRREIARGQYATLDEVQAEYRHGMDSPPRKARAKKPR
jgi:metal-responsive CopG/Arc/MetJ family transcriptional regulator